MPRQDAAGRWISDDGRQYWDGNAWRPIGVQAQGRARVSLVPTLLIAGGVVLVVMLVLGIGAIVMFSNPYYQRSFCNGWNGGSNSENLTCPFHPSP